MKLIRSLVALAVGFAMAAPFGLMAHDAHHETQRKAYDYARAEETPFGRAVDPATVKSVVRIAMDDTMRYTPDRITLKRGEAVRFIVTNRGKQMHEMVLGTRKELEQHAQMMRKHPDMEHDEPHMLHVVPGRTGEVGWRFTRAGEFEYGCLVPGHFEAGMVGKIVVTEK